LQDLRLSATRLLDTRTGRFTSRDAQLDSGARVATLLPRIPVGEMVRMAIEAGRAAQLPAYRSALATHEMVLRCQDNLYVYAANSPCLVVDPSGQFTVVELLIVIAIVAVLVALVLPTVLHVRRDRRVASHAHEISDDPAKYLSQQERALLGPEGQADPHLAEQRQQENDAVRGALTAANAGPDLVSQLGATLHIYGVPDEYMGESWALTKPQQPHMHFRQSLIDELVAGRLDPRDFAAIVRGEFFRTSADAWTGRRGDCQSQRQWEEWLLSQDRTGVFYRRISQLVVLGEPLPTHKLSRWRTLEEVERDCVLKECAKYYPDKKCCD